MLSLMSIVRHTLRVMLLSLCMFLSAQAQANEQLIRQVLEPKLKGSKIEGIQPAPMAGLFEVRFRSAEGIQVIYTDARAEHIIVGNLYEAKSDRNLTEERIAKLSAIKFESLPLDQAIKIVRGNGRRVVAMFTDPYCPACQSFEQTLQQLDDITVYVFMFPVIRPERSEHSKIVWCSSDRAKAWLDLALRKRPPTGSASCDHPVDKNLALGQSLGVRATPTLFFRDGDRVQGGMTLAALRAKLDEGVAKR